MRDYFAHQPKQLSNYLARREWSEHKTLPPELERIKQNLLNRTPSKKAKSANQ